MAQKDFLDIVDDIRAHDSSYRREAYAFIMRALDFVVRGLPSPRHVTGQQLLAGVVELAKDQFGPLAPTVFQEWGLSASHDVGAVVFHLVDAGVLGKRPEDHIEDFDGGIDLSQALQPGNHR